MGTVNMITTVLIVLQCIPIIYADCFIKCGVVETTRGDSSLLDLIRDVWTDIQHTRNLRDMTITFETLQHRTDMDWDTFVQAYMDIGNTNVSAIVGPYAQPIVASSERNGIPYFAMDSTPEQPYTPYNLLRVFPDPSEIYKIAVVITKRYGIEDVIIFYDSFYGLQLVEELVQMPQLHVRAYKLNYSAGVQHIRSILLSVRQLVVTNFIVMASRSLTHDILEQALYLSMMSRRFTWILPALHQDEGALIRYAYTEVNLTTFRLTNGDIIVNARSQKWFTEFEYTTLYDALLTLYDGVKLHSRSFNNCLWAGKDHLLQGLSQVDIEGATGSLSYRRDGSRQGYIVDVLGFQSAQLEKVGYWNSSQEEGSRLQLSFDGQDETTTSLEYPLGKEVVNVVTMLEDPFVMLKSDHHRWRGNDKYEGYCVDLVKHIADDLGFEYEIYISPDRQFGSRNELDGSWNGLIKELIVGNATMSVASLTITAEREEVIDFSKPFRPRGLSIMMKKSEKQRSFFQLLDPLSPVVWALILVVLVIISLILYIVDRLSPLSNHKDYQCTLTECIWFTFASLLRNGVDYAPRSVPGKVMAGFLWFFSLIIVSTYTANLAAFLTISKFLTPIHSVFDLANQAKVQYGTVWNSATSDFFEHNKLEYFQQVWQFMSIIDKTGMVDSHNEGIDRVKNSDGDYAFIWDADVIRHEVNKHCDLVEVGQVFDNAKGYGVGTPRGAGFRDDISMAILRLSDAGKLAELDSRWWEPPTCPDAVKQKATGKRRALTVESIAGVFVVLVVGVVLSICTAIIMYFVNLKQRKHTKHKDVNDVRNDFGKEERNNCHNRIDKHKYHNDVNLMSATHREPFLSNVTVNAPGCSKQTNIF